MKICKYCDTENVDSAVICAACGGNEFKHKCGNCGTVFDVGNFCPICGVKVGEKAKKCPSCGAEYFSAACPDCGYMRGNDGRQADSQSPAFVPNPRKRRTGLWVLGWLFIFPVPLTILMLRNKTMKKWLRIGIIAVAWILYIAFVLLQSAISK